MGEIFAVTSGKGGVGKSSVSVGLSFAFGSVGKSVLLVDVDVGLRCLDLLLGADGAAVFDLSDVLAGKDIGSAACPCPANGVFLIAAPLKNERINPAAFHRFAEDAVQKFDVVIFDFPAGADFTLYKELPKETLFLTVAVPDPVSLRDASFVRNGLCENGLSSRLVINRFDSRKNRKVQSGNIDDIIDETGIQLIGIIPESEEITLLPVNHTYKPRGRLMKAFMRIANRLSGNYIPLPNPKKI